MSNINNNQIINQLHNKLLINGQWLDGSGELLVSTNPATDEIVWRGNTANESDINLAYEAAENAFADWALTSIGERLVIIEKYKILLTENKENLATDIMVDTGKPYWESLTEAATMIGKIDISIKSYTERTGLKQSGEGNNQTQLTHRPHGVCVVFGPYNFPGHLPNGHIVPALIAGNTIIFKPSEQAPKVGERMVALLNEAGIPAGVINFLPGELETAKMIVSNEKLKGLFFTGSSTVGTIIHQQFAGRPDKILALEMGGNNPLIVWDDVSIEAAVYNTVQSAFITSGQRCTCARRLIVPTGQFGDEFIEKLVSTTANIQIAEPTADPAPFYSTVINNKSADLLLNAQTKIEKLGGKILLEMKRIIVDKPYISPSIIDVTNVNNIVDEEYFGPLLKVYRVNSFDEAIKTANDTKYGLSAGIFTESKDNWHKFYTLSQAGIVNWNKPLTGASGAAPFGGTGYSGNHKPGAYYAADYCAYPVASLIAESLELPESLAAGIIL